MGGAQSHAELGDDAPVAQRMEGPLMKESETLKSWNQRYAVLRDRVLSYWDSEAEAKAGELPRGRISMENCKVSYVDPLTSDAFVVETPTDAKRLAAQRSQTKMYFQATTKAELRTWVRKLQLASREPWHANEPATHCALCDRPFDELTRKHHCRRCGLVVCQSCSPNKQAMIHYAYPDPVRVCTECYGHKTQPLPPEWEREAMRAARRLADVERSQHEARLSQTHAETPEERKERIRKQFNVSR